MVVAAAGPADAAGRAPLRAECPGLIAQDGIAYQALNQLAYGYSWPAFPHRHTGQLNWTFLDASTGQMIEAVLAREPGGRPAPIRPRPRFTDRLSRGEGLQFLS
jgi:hypothetical protein